MKVAFVGKGGSGKSTLTALYIRYLQRQGRNVMAIDADLNMNLSGLMGVTASPHHNLSNPQVADAVRTYLIGENKRIGSTDMFLPTTPPGTGSNIIRTFDDPGLLPFSANVGDNTTLLTVGTYDTDGIGQTCYHSHLFVAENILSHTRTGDSFDLVCDMVAGTDAFAYSLHLQFDAIILIAEPTPESAEVCTLYLKLAVESGISSIVHVVANKVEDESDLEYIRRKVGLTPIAAVPRINALKKSRQDGAPVTEAVLRSIPDDVMPEIDRVARSPEISEIDRFKKLQDLHVKLNAKKWVQLGYGDILHQIDTSFPAEDAA